MHQVFRIDQFEHFVDSACPGGAVEACQSIGHIGADAQVREQRGLLRHQRGVPGSGLEPQAVRGVGEQLAVE